MKIPKSGRAEMHALLVMRDTTRALLEEEAQSSQDTAATRTLRDRLNSQYDAYLERFGPINRFTLRRTGRTDDDGRDVMARISPRTVTKFTSDPFAAPVRALEIFDETSGQARKAAIFHRRVIERRAPVTRADSPADALAICLDQRGAVDLPVIADLLDVGQAQAREHLTGLVFDDPATGGLVPAAEYLSGDVRTKLAQAEVAAAEDATLSANIDALRPIIPTDLGPDEIHANFGAVWIPAEDVELFLKEILDDPTVQVRHGAGAIWSVRGNRRSVAATSTWGTDRLTAIDLVSRLIQQQETVVRDEVDTPDGSTIRVINPEETDAANEKATALREAFADWVWADPQRAERLAQGYNTMFNSTVLRSYDGEHLTLPGLATWFTPHPHQRAAVHRITSEPSVGLFHQVGAGKTAEMVMGAMELRRLGMVTKPAIVVPNHMLDQFSREFLSLYPGASVLAAGRDELAKEQRRLFVAKVATGDWDAIIMTRGAFQALPVSVDTERTYLHREQDALRASLEKLRSDAGADTRLIKRQETQLLNNEERIKKAMDQRRDPGLTFEQLGIDYLMVDELHDYKNMRLVSSIRDAAQDGSLRAIDLDMKVDYLRRTNGERVFTGATATPIANSVAEAYVMQRYIRPDLLEGVGITDFDSWAATFGETVTQVELAPEGGGNYRTNTRFARFRNVPELLRLWHVAADVKTADDLPYLQRPLLRERADGQRSPESVLITPSQTLRDYVAQLGERAEKVRARLVHPSEDNMLKVSSEGRGAALDLRLVELEPPEDELFSIPTKLEVAADRIVQVWLENLENVYPSASDEGEPPTKGALQIVFSDLGTPGSKVFNAYGHLKDLLVDRGMDPARIRFIHDAGTDQKKAVLFEQCRSGGVDVLVGSTSKMGVGTNIQTRAVALHHLDCPWRPADIEQREGRILRQGNLNAEVSIFRYVVEGSFDAYSWQTVERKARFIDQLMRGSLDRREIEDIGDSTLSFNEVKALASGDPLVLERAEVEQEVATLTRLQRAHAKEQTGLRHKIAETDREITVLQERVPRLEAVISRSIETRGDAFRAIVAGISTTERAEAATAVRHLLGQSRATLDRHTRPEMTVNDALQVGGHVFEGRLRLNSFTGDGVQLRLAAVPEVAVDVALDDSGHGVITKVENAVAGLPRLRNDTQSRLERALVQRDAAQDGLGAPFARMTDLENAQARLESIDQKMSATQGPPQAERANQPDPVVDPCVAATSQAVVRHIDDIHDGLRRSAPIAPIQGLSR
ncbi:helicase [Janibacter melonis]|uniref:helicase-related protein n=1 Tax=Janibacter melonis TaxID=262209 RepID=UPI0020440E72|nr:helicase-related protein [Janibacter melonis]MCM3556362.1 helicase [Janibacter melonis]